MKTVQLLTRRSVLGAGLACASLTGIAGVKVNGLIARDHLELQSFDALLVDATIEMPRQMAAFIDASREALPVVEIRLDAHAQAGLSRLLAQSRAIVGISAGATLFCLERIAWDHGFRLAGRNQRCTSNLNDDACLQDAADFVAGAYPSIAGRSTVARSYRPSRADRALHAWVMQKSRRED